MVRPSGSCEGGRGGEEGGEKLGEVWPGPGAIRPSWSRVEYSDLFPAQNGQT